MKSFFFIDNVKYDFNDHNILWRAKKFVESFFILFFMIALVLLVIITPLDLFINKFLHYESIMGLISKSHKKINEHPFYVLVFIVPFIEEIFFRLALIVNKFNISIFLGMLSYKLLGGQVIRFDIRNQYFIYCILISITISVLSYFYFSVKYINFLNQRKNWLIIISIVLFGLIHIFNIKELHWQLALFYPIFVLPQMIMGYFITNLRLKYGFVWGFLLHALFNAVSILISHF